MGIEGRITIDLAGAPDHEGGVAIASSRPLKLTRTFVGRSPRETVRALPSLFSVCGLAQGAAAAEACERALGIEATAGTRTVRQLLVLSETLREHLIRAVADWPRFVGLAPRKDDALRVMYLCEGLRKTLDPERAALSIGGSAKLEAASLGPALEGLSCAIEGLVLGEPIEGWNERLSADDLAGWAQAGSTPARALVRLVLKRGWANLGRAETQFLPRLADADLMDRLLGPEAEAFVSAPTWNGAPHETTALSRQAENALVRDLLRSHGSGLLTRLAARLVEIVEALTAIDRVAQDSSQGNGAMPSAAHGRGISQVEAARGRLVHGVEIEGDTVRRYAVLAPTEWNFHGRGSAARGLADIAARGSETQRIAELFITALDPCVGYEVRVH